MPTKDKAKQAAYQRAYWNRHRERLLPAERERSRQRHLADPAAHYNRYQKWARSNPLVVRWCSYRNHANERGLAFELSRDEFAAIVVRPCVWCGSLAEDTPRGFHGVDRIDNSSGYIQGNCVPCCRWCNRAKDTRTAAAFKEWAVRLGTHILSGQAP